MMLILPVLIRFVPSISTQLVLIRLKQWLWLDHQVLTLPGVHFLGILGGFIGVESEGIQVNVICPLLSSLKAFIFLLKEGKGITLLLHSSKNGGLYGMVFVVYVNSLYHPECQNSTSTVSVGKFVSMKPKKKLHTRIDLSCHFLQC